MDVKNKVAIITGGIGGIGHATVKLLLQKGAKFVGITDILPVDSDAVKNCTNELKRKFGDDKFKYYRVNVRNITEFTSCYDEILASKGYVDIVINNAGIINDPDIDAIVGINFIAVVKNTLESVKRMNKTKGGVIVNIGSNFGLVNAPASMPVYNATKHAMVSFCRSMKEYNKTLGVRIVTLCPGATKSNLVSGSIEDFSKKFFDFVNRSYIEGILYSTEQQKPESAASAIVEIIERGKEGDVWFVYKDEPPFNTGEETDIEKLRIPF